MVHPVSMLNEKKEKLERKIKDLECYYTRVAVAGFSMEVISGMVSLSFCCLRLHIKKSTIAKTITTSPPITPPTIAPRGIFLSPFSAEPVPAVTVPTSVPEVVAGLSGVVNGSTNPTEVVVCTAVERASLVVDDSVTSEVIISVITSIFVVWIG